MKKTILITALLLLAVVLCSACSKNNEASVTPSPAASEQNRDTVKETATPEPTAEPTTVPEPTEEPAPTEDPDASEKFKVHELSAEESLFYAGVWIGLNGENDITLFEDGTYTIIGEDLVPHSGTWSVWDNGSIKLDEETPDFFEAGMGIIYIDTDDYFFLDGNEYERQELVTNDNDVIADIENDVTPDIDEDSSLIWDDEQDENGYNFISVTWKSLNDEELPELEINLYSESEIGFDETEYNNEDGSHTKEYRVFKGGFPVQLEIMGDAPGSNSTMMLKDSYISICMSRNDYITIFTSEEDVLKEHLTKAPTGLWFYDLPIDWDNLCIGE